MAATPDGRTLATGDMLGTIKLWDFESLHLLYCIKSPDYEIRSLAFSGDGLRLFDIRDTKSKVWEPAALVRKAVSDDSSVSDSASGNDTAVTVGDYGETVAITVILVPGEADCVFFGKEDASIHSYHIATGSINHLYSHRLGVLPTSISWNPEAQLIATCDSASSILVWRLEKQTRDKTKWQSKSKVIQITWHEHIHEISLSPCGSHLSIHDSNIRILRLSEPQTNAFSSKFPGQGQESTGRFRWVKDFVGRDALLSVADNGSLSVNPLHCDEVSLSATISMRLLDDHGSTMSRGIRQVALDPGQEFILLEFEDEECQNGDATKILLYEVRDLMTTSVEAQTPREITPILVLRSSEVRLFLGFCGTKLVFLDKILWVRSYDFANGATGNREGIAGVEGAPRHFFIPFELIGGNNGVDGAVTKSGDILFPKEGELGVVKNALTWSI